MTPHILIVEDSRTQWLKDRSQRQHTSAPDLEMQSVGDCAQHRLIGGKITRTCRHLLIDLIDQRCRPVQCICQLLKITLLKPVARALMGDWTDVEMMHHRVGDIAVRLISCNKRAHLTPQAFPGR